MIDRIKQTIEYSQLSSSAFADTIGISRSGLTHLLTGRNQPSLDVARKILAKFPEISTEWLIMGMGEMFRTDVEVPENRGAEVKSKPDSRHPAENSKFIAQTDLFGEFENTEDSEEDVPAEEDEQLPAVAAESTDNEESTDEPASPEPSNPPTDGQETPEPSRPTPVRTQPARTRRTQEAKPASASLRRERHEPLSNLERKLTQIVFFYDDHSFEVYTIQR